MSSTRERTKYESEDMISFSIQSRMYHYEDFYPREIPYASKTCVPTNCVQPPNSLGNYCHFMSNFVEPSESYLDLSTRLKTQYLQKKDYGEAIISEEATPNWSGSAREIEDEFGVALSCLIEDCLQSMAFLLVV